MENGGLSLLAVGAGEMKGNRAAYRQLLPPGTFSVLAHVCFLLWAGLTGSSWICSCVMLVSRGPCPRPCLPADSEYGQFKPWFWVIYHLVETQCTQVWPKVWQPHGLEGTQIFVVVKIMAASKGIKEEFKHFEVSYSYFGFEVGSCTYEQMLFFAEMPSFNFRMNILIYTLSSQGFLK